MNISKVWAVSFSPTRTTKKIVDAVLSGIAEKNIGTFDLTYPTEGDGREFQEDELVVLGVPVYAGRVAPLAAERLAAVKGNKSPAVLVVVYGNRDYEDALIELRDLAEKASFIPLATAAFIGEHSFSSEDFPIAHGRPDSDDLAEAVSLGREVAEKVGQLQGPCEVSTLQIPGCSPYKEAMGPLPITPVVEASACTLCGLCIKTCPGGAITIDDTLVMDVARCIFCCACVKYCPEKAVSIAAPTLAEKRLWLSKNCAVRKKPELYI